MENQSQIHCFSDHNVHNIALNSLEIASARMIWSVCYIVKDV